MQTDPARIDQVIFDMGIITGMLLRYKLEEILDAARRLGLEPEYRDVLLRLATIRDLPVMPR